MSHRGNVVLQLRCAGESFGSSVLVIWGLEAVACREALALVEDLGPQQFDIASEDCLNAVKHTHDGCYAYGGVTKDIKSWSDSFSSCVFVHESSKSNYEPRALAFFRSGATCLVRVAS